MAAIVSRMNSLRMTERLPGLRTCLLAGSQHGAKSLLTGMTELAPLCETPVHWHDCEEVSVIMEGKALVDLGEESYELSAGDCILIQASRHHRIINLSLSARLRILWIYPSLMATRSLASGGKPAPMDMS